MVSDFKNCEGWRDPLKWAGPGILTELKELSSEVRKRAEVFLLVGVGGSNQAARAVIEALKPQGGPEILYIGNSLSAMEMQRVLNQIEEKSVYLNVIAKNFETLEPGIAFRILRVWMKKRYGDDYAHRIIATGTKGGSLEKLCREKGYRFLEFPEDIGGRYSAVSSVGLFPMAVAGLDIEAVVQGALCMRKEILEEGTDHLSCQYARWRYEQYQKGRRIELLAFFEPSLRWFSGWWVQLFAESEGKQEKGLYPVGFSCTEDLHSTGQFVQEGTKLLAETFLKIEDMGASVMIEADSEEDGFSYLNGMELTELNRIAQEAVLEAHKSRNPCFELRIPELNAYQFGRLFYFFEYSCCVSAEMLGVNPFDQPGVEAYKQLLYQALGKEGKRE